MIVEITNLSGKSIIEADARIKIKADAALAAGEFSSLPLMTLYHVENPQNGWRVISRTPSPEEKATIRIVFRSPKASDVDKIWNKMIFENQASSHDAVLKFLEQVARELTLPASETSVTRATEILFERILFDRAPEFLADAIRASDFQISENGMVKGFSDFSVILNAFAKRLPSDPRTGQLAFAIYDKLKNGRSLIKSKETFQFLSASLSGIAADKRVEIAEWMLSTFDKEILRVDVTSLGRIIAGILSFTTAEKKLSLRRHFLKTAEFGQINSENFFESRELLQEILGAARGQSFANSAFLNETKKLAEVFSAPHVGTNSFPDDTFTSF